MNPGRLDQTVTVQTRTIARDAFGGAVETWADTQVVWAEIATLSGREFYEARQVVAQAQARVTIRWMEGLNPGENRIKAGSVVYDIISIAEKYGRRAYLELLCERRVTP